MTGAALALVASVLIVATLAYHAMRVWMTLAHGRLLAQDKNADIIRELSLHADSLKQLRLQLGALDNATQEFYVRFATLKDQRWPTRAEFLALDNSISAMGQQLSGIQATEKRMLDVEDLTTARDKAIELLGEQMRELTADVVKIKEKEVLAMQGIMNIGKRGLRQP